MIRIIVDSTCDLSREELEASGIVMLPLTIHFGSDSYRDAIDLDTAGFYARLRTAKALPTTSQVPPGDFEEVFRPLCEAGDEAVVITLSSHLSATHASALGAAEATDPQRIHVVDSASGSFGAALLVRQAVALRDGGAPSALAIAQQLRALAPRVRIIAAVDTLKYLRMGGRLSGSQAFIGTLLGIRPLVEVREGRVSAAGHVRGEKNVVRALLKRFEAERVDLSLGVAFAHGDAPELMRHTVDAFRPLLEGVRVYTGQLGAVIGTHVGPGVVGVGYILKAE